MKNKHVNSVKTPAVLFGVVGAFLIAMPDQGLRAGGFTVLIIGNIFWVIYGRIANDWHLITLFGFYAITAGIGLFFSLPPRYLIETMWLFLAILPTLSVLLICTVFFYYFKYRGGKIE